jgi:hypothetical protein
MVVSPLSSDGLYVVVQIGCIEAQSFANLESSWSFETRDLRIQGLLCDLDSLASQVGDGFIYIEWFV